MFSRLAPLLGLFVGLIPALVVRGQTTATSPVQQATGPVVVVSSTQAAPPAARPTPLPPVPGNVPPLNQLVLNQINEMPRLGGYAVTRAAADKLAAAVRFDPANNGRLLVNPAGATPSYCSGATYLVFLKAVAALRAQNRLPGVDGPALEALLVRGQRDGEGVWGRWNANGPGTARLFHELRLGRNFTRFEDALPGDFLKVFWTTAVGKKERGHSVVFLGREVGADGAEAVRFWSSNQGTGYGVKVVPRAKIAHAIFSRLERPENLGDAAKLPAVDEYLAGLLSKESSAAEAGEKSAVR